MKKSQLRAISYSYAEKAKKENWEKATLLEIDKIYNYQDAYKTIRGFVSATTDAKKKAIANAIPKIEARKIALEKCNCTSEKYTDCIAALDQANKFIKNN